MTKSAPSPSGPPAPAASASAQFRHAISNLVASVAGDRAHATCYLLEYMTENGEAKLLTPGEYDCDLMRVSGKWLFSERRITLDQPFPIML